MHVHSDGTTINVEPTGFKAILGSSLSNKFDLVNASCRERLATIHAMITNVLPNPMPSAKRPPRMSSGLRLLEPVIICRYLVAALAVRINRRGFFPYPSMPELDVSERHNVLGFSVVVIFSLCLKKSTASL